MINIIVAFPKEENGKNIKNILTRNGFQVPVICSSGAQVIKEANSLHEGVVVCAYRFSDMIYRELREDLPPEFEMVVLSSRQQWEDNGDSRVVNLSMPLKVHELVSTLEMVVYTAEKKRRKRKNTPRKRSAEEQELIAKAKEILMDRNNMTEEEAHRYLQKTSMDNSTSFTETAQMILSLMDGA